MIKYKFFLDLTKEENWLREMSTKGHGFQNKKIGYQFEQNDTSESVYRIDYQTFKHREDYLDYIALFEDSGWIHIAGTKSSGKQYFKKDETNEAFKEEYDIFSDGKSKATRYKKMMYYFGSNFLFLISLTIVFFDESNLVKSLNPKSLYLTPGLWQSNGLSFWFSFLFETPFALARGFLWYLFPVSAIICVYYYIKSRLLWKAS
ncbi:DUF2812 domain-containing protein [Marinilactibacillus kalidii]|uniref:DUF2812 domain-containing protein n=1 Tax=Marinilactibacillus kalidii TaxID=2820274 RepID=UPI001ABDB7C5|nr:DUF2812 domain-containing protein [Marinilactibacillus kalidii]